MVIIWSQMVMALINVKATKLNTEKATTDYPKLLAGHVNQRSASDSLYCTSTRTKSSNFCCVFALVGVTTWMYGKESGWESGAGGKVPWTSRRVYDIKWRKLLFCCGILLLFPPWIYLSVVNWSRGSMSGYAWEVFDRLWLTRWMSPVWRPPKPGVETQSPLWKAVFSSLFFAKPDFCVLGDFTIGSTRWLRYWLVNARSPNILTVTFIICLQLLYFYREETRTSS